jgi:hypothetical protein
MVSNNTLFIFIAILAFLCWNFYNRVGKEGMTTTSTENGIAANSTSYATQVTTQLTTLQNQLLIDTYKTNYENIITNLEEIMSLTILQLALSLSPSSPNIQTIQDMNTLNEAKITLADILKFLQTN